MALGNIKYQAEFDTIYDVNYKIRIYDEDWGGAATDFNVESPGFTLTYDGKGKKRNHEIKASSVSIYALAENAAFDTFTRTIREGAQGRFRVEILRENVPYWRGTILSDIGSEALSSYPNSVTLRAIDGLSLMKEIPFNTDVYGGALSTKPHIEVIQNMIKYYSNIFDFYGASDDILRTCVNWYEADQPTPAAGIDPLEYSQTPLGVFRTWSPDGSARYASAYDVLKEYCRLWGARIFQSNAVWCFFQESAYRNTTYYRNYHPSASSPDDSALLGGLTIRAGTKQDGDDFVILEGGRQAYYPVLKKTKTIYGDWSNNVLWNENYTLNAGAAPTLQADVAYVPLIANTSLQVAFNCKMQLPITTADPLSGTYYWGNPPDESLDYWIAVHVIIKVGTYYYTNMGWQGSVGKYTAHFSAGAYYMAVANALGGDQNIVVPVEFEMPTVPAAGQLSFGAYFDIWEGDGATQNAGTNTFQGAMTVEFIFQGANGPFNPNIFQGNTITFIQEGDVYAEREFVSENGTSTANEELDLGTQLMGDGPNPWNLGRIEVSDDGVTWSVGVESTWQAFGTGITANISKVLVNQFQAGQQESLPILQCGFVKQPLSNVFMQFGEVLEYKGALYIPNGWAYNAYDETYKGEWYLTTSDFTGLTETEVVESSSAAFIDQIEF